MSEEIAYAEALARRVEIGPINVDVVSHDITQLRKPCIGSGLSPGN